jgi:hypothetical protein
MAGRQMSQTEKDSIRSSLTELVESLAAKHELFPETVANEAFYLLQRHPHWGRNATKAQKRASFTYWKGLCYRCGEALSFAEAKFHHLKRGIPNQHGPTNLVPEHLECHDAEHKVAQGSLSKGSPRRREMAENSLPPGSRTQEEKL